MNTFKLYDIVTTPFKGHGFGDNRLIAYLHQRIEAKLATRQSTLIEINGYKLRIHGLSGGICVQLMREQEYEPVTTSIIQNLLPSVLNAVDIGANIGYYTLLMSQKAQGRVWAFEPEDKNLDVLHANIELNHANNITVLPYAVSDARGIGNLFVSKIESGEHSLVVKRHYAGIQFVPIVCLDGCFQSTSIDLIKTDTEGNDFKVLLGAKQLLKRNPALSLITEFWPEGIVKSGYVPNVFWEYLRCYFRNISIIDEIDGEIVPGTFEEAVNRSAKGLSVNLLCTNKEAA